MNGRQIMTISLPPEMLAEFEHFRKTEHRTKSELVREALREYFEKRIPVVRATAAEIRAIRRGRAAIARGDYVTLDELKRELASRNIRSRKKTNTSNPRKRS